MSPQNFVSDEPLLVLWYWCFRLIVTAVGEQLSVTVAQLDRNRISYSHNANWTKTIVYRITEDRIVSRSVGTILVIGSWRRHPALNEMRTDTSTSCHLVFRPMLDLNGGGAERSGKQLLFSFVGSLQKIARVILTRLTKFFNPLKIMIKFDLMVTSFQA